MSGLSRWRAKTIAPAMLACLCAWVCLTPGIFPGTGAATQALAQGSASPLTVEFRALTPLIRTASPVPIEVNFKNNSSDVIRGRLEFQSAYTNSGLLQYVTQPLVLAPGKLRAQLLLPAGFIEGGENVIRPRFLLEQGEIRFADFTLSLPTNAERSLVMGLSAPAGRVSPAFQPLLTALRLDRFNPEPTASSRGIITTIARVLPDQLPTSPLGLAGYDAMLLPGAGFTELDEDQLATLAAWTRAGGSLCVALGDEPITPAQARFLRRLSGDASLPLPIADASLGLDREGPPVRLYHAELGMLMVVLTPPASTEAFVQAPWPGAIARFWKASAAQLKTLDAGGHWRTDLEVPSPETQNYNEMIRRNKAMQRQVAGASTQPDAGTVYLPMGPKPVSQGQSLAQSLMPRDIRPVPWSVLALILGAFILLVGPIDYFALGLVRRRVLTWALFPVACVTCLVAVLAAATHYLGQHDRAANLVIVDIGQGGRVLRETRLELVLAGAEQAHPVEIREGLFCPVGPHWISGGLPSYGYRPMGSGRANTALVEGRYPGSYKSTRWLEQWQPSISRFTRIAPADVKVPAWNWDGFDPAPHLPSAQLPIGLPARYADAAKATSMIDRDGSPTLDQMAERFLAGKDEATLMTIARTPQSHDLVTTLFHENALQLDPFLGSDTSTYLLTWLGPLSARYREGFFSIVSGISPNGAADLEDLSMLDQADTSQVVLVATQRRGADLYIYRRLYRAGPNDGSIGPAPEVLMPAPTEQPQPGSEPVHLEE